jgi:flagellar hook-length control protein FliK
MMTQPSSATSVAAAGAAVLAGAPAEGSDGAGSEAQATPGGANPAPFSQALQALALGTDPAGALLAAASAGAAVAAAAGTAGAAGIATGSRLLATAQGNGASTAAATAALPGGAASLPKDLLLALFAAEAAAAGAGGAQRKTGQAGIDDTHAAAVARELQDGTPKADQSATAQAAPADPGAALLAAVLQWLQQQHAGARTAGESRTSDGKAPGSAADAANTMAVATGTAAGISDSATIMAAAVRADGAGAAGTMLAAAPGASLSSELASQRDGDGRAAGGDQPRTPALVADIAGSGSAGMDMAAALRAASAASPTLVERSVAVPVHERHWPTALAAQVLVLSNDKVQAATLRLSPEHLGPVEVRIDMQESSVNVSFTAAHADTRAALEQAMPQLRAVLAGAGLSLGQATVQQQARRESQNSNALPRTGGTTDEPIEAPAAVTRALGMIDEYV